MTPGVPFLGGRTIRAWDIEKGHGFCQLSCLLYRPFYLTLHHYSHLTVFHRFFAPICFKYSRLSQSWCFLIKKNNTTQKSENTRNLRRGPPERYAAMHRDGYLPDLLYNILHWVRDVHCPHHRMRDDGRLRRKTRLFEKTIGVFGK